MPEVKIKKFTNIDELIKLAALKFVEIARRSIKGNGLFKIALSGGRTPAHLYNMLAGKDFKDSLEWDKVHFFFGDERCVSPNHSDSNFKMANDALLSKINLPSGNVHRIMGELGKESAEFYERDIKESFLNCPLSFDLILLGMGDDGHTASIFPGSSIVFESSRLVCYTYVESLGKFRISITPKLINNAQNIIFLVTGEKKSEVLKEVLEGVYKPDIYPSQIVRNCAGKVYWYLDIEVSNKLSI